MGLGSVERHAADLGEMADFERFVRTQREALVCFLRRRTGSEEDAQDLAQESLTRLLRYRGHTPEAWTSLLYRIARNALNDQLRRARARYEEHHVSLQVIDSVVAVGQPDTQAASAQELALLQRAILGLPRRCREVYLLNRIEGMSYKDIAEHCGISVKAVEKQVSKALRILRAQLEGATEDTGA